MLSQEHQHYLFNTDPRFPHETLFICRMNCFLLENSRSKKIPKSLSEGRLILIIQNMNESEYFSWSDGVFALCRVVFAHADRLIVLPPRAAGQAIECCQH
jgi:hypothetical protein